MTDQLRTFLKNNITLIKSEDFAELFNTCPDSIVVELSRLLTETGIHLDKSFSDRLYEPLLQALVAQIHNNFGIRAYYLDKSVIKKSKTDTCIIIKSYLGIHADDSIKRQHEQIFEFAKEYIQEVIGSFDLSVSRSTYNFQTYPGPRCYRVTYCVLKFYIR